MSRPPSDIRDRAVRATIALAAEFGAAGVTFDAVAARCGVSKGAVLHHFRTKDALLGAAVEGIVGEFRMMMSTATAIDPNPVGAFSRTMLLYAVPSELNDALRGVLSMVLERPELAAPWHDFTRWCHERVRHDGIDPVIASVVMAATDGFWLSGVVGLPAIPPDLLAGTQLWLVDLLERETTRAMRTMGEIGVAG